MSRGQLSKTFTSAAFVFRTIARLINYTNKIFNEIDTGFVTDSVQKPI